MDCLITWTCVALGRRATLPRVGSLWLQTHHPCLCAWQVTSPACIQTAPDHFSTLSILRQCTVINLLDRAAGTFGGSSDDFDALDASVDPPRLVRSCTGFVAGSTRLSIGKICRFLLISSEQGGDLVWG